MTETIYTDETSTFNPKASETQVAGDHYKRLKPEPWEIMEGWNREHFIGFLRYNALKRLGRWDSKDGALQDVTKAIHELTRLKELLEEDAQAKPTLVDRETGEETTYEEVLSDPKPMAGPAVTAEDLTRVIRETKRPTDEPRYPWPGDPVETD